MEPIINSIYEKVMKVAEDTRVLSPEKLALAKAEVVAAKSALAVKSAAKSRPKAMERLSAMQNKTSSKYD